MFKKILFLLFIVYIVWFIFFSNHYPYNISLKAPDNFWGVTFSPKFAEELDLDWKEVYLATLDDLEVKNIRLPIYWDDIEKNEGEYDFSTYDYILDEGSKRNVKYIVNIGWRLPRWPECHTPIWLEDEDISSIKNKSLIMIKTVMERYKDREEIIVWQVENEPLLNSFGICPDGDLEFLKKEINFVKSIDDRPIIISASGELSSWKKEAELGDVFATTMYRTVWTKYFGYFKYPLPAWFYRLKAKIANKDVNDIIISELQAEPWVPQNGNMIDLSVLEQDKSLSLDQFKANLQFAINTGFKQTYLWGVEWWYWRKVNGDISFWSTAKNLF